MRPLGLVPAALVVLAGCSGGDQAVPREEPTASMDTAGSTTSSAATTTTPTATGTADGAGAGWDCAAIEQARQDLAATTNDVLERVDIDRSDPRAFSVQVLVAAQRGDEYWTAVRDAIPPEESELLSDAETVVRYWTSVDAQLEAIDLTGGDPAALQEATDRYLAVMAETPEVEVLPVQERLTAGVDAACADGSSS